MKVLANKIKISLAITLLIPNLALGEIFIEIVGAADNAIPVGVLPFITSGSKDNNSVISEVIEQNLIRSGLFKNGLSVLHDSPRATLKPNYTFYRHLGVENIVTGRVTQTSNGRYSVQVTLHDALRKQINWSRTWKNISPNLFRKLAHRASDLILKEITGSSGVFESYLAYVEVETDPKNRRNKVYRLKISESDGENATTIITSREPILSPSWSPDNKSIAYVAFRNGRSGIYIQSLATKRREKIADFKGVNSAPAWSPDGGKIAFTSSQSGNPDIYTIDLKTRLLTKITHSPSIDTESVFSYDGLKLFFTSDRSGSPQIYEYAFKTQSVARISNRGRYNSNPSPNQKGDTLALISGEKGSYQLSLINLNNNEKTIISNSFLDESPSFSANGLILIYASTSRKSGLGELIMISANGRAKQTLRSSKKHIRDPAWSYPP